MKPILSIIGAMLTAVASLAQEPDPQGIVTHGWMKQQTVDAGRLDSVAKYVADSVATAKAKAIVHDSLGTVIAKSDTGANGVVVTHKNLNDAIAGVSGGVPAGVIVMWSGTLANIPSGWALCNGSSGTPDLREKFVKGTATGVDPGGTGGAATHDHAYGTIAVATHSAGTTGAASAGATQRGSTTSTLTLAAHTHSTPQLTHTVSGNTASGSSEPAYFAIAYIMKL